VPSTGPSRGGGGGFSDRGGGFGDRDGAEKERGGFGDRYSERRSGFGEGDLDRADNADKYYSLPPWLASLFAVHYQEVTPGPAACDELKGAKCFAVQLISCGCWHVAVYVSIEGPQNLYQIGESDLVPALMT